jgi:hypothetical protein
MNEEGFLTVSELVKSASGDPQVGAYIRTIAGHEDDPFMAGYAEFGVPWSSAACSSPHGLKDIADYRANVGSNACSAWMDNTTIFTACKLMTTDETELMGPLTVWDLATFVRAVVCYERIYHHEHPGINDKEVNRLLESDVLVKVPLPTRYSEGILPDPWDGAHRWMCDVWFAAHHWLKRLSEASGKSTLDGRQMEEVTQAWRLALGRQDIESSDLADFKGVSTRWTSPSNRLLVETANVTELDEHRTSLEPSERIEQVFAALRKDGVPDTFLEFRRNVLSDLNIRSYVNQRLAEFFELPYACSLARLPFRNHLYDRSIAIQQELTTAKYLDQRYRELAANVSLRLPVFLALALRSAGSQKELWGHIAELRTKAADFRQHRKDMDTRLARGDLHKVKEVSRALQLSTEGFLKLAGKATFAAGEVVVERISTGDIGPVGTAISAFLAAAQGVFKSSWAERVMWRLRKPELLWINNVVEESKHLTDAMPDFARVWKLPQNRKEGFAERFAKMSRLGSPPKSMQPEFNY